VRSLYLLWPVLILSTAGNFILDWPWARRIVAVACLVPLAVIFARLHNGRLRRR